MQRENDILKYIFFHLLNNAKIHIKMRVSKKIREKIKKDNRFSLLLALKVDRMQSAVRQLVDRNSTKLTEALYVEFYKEQGFTEDEIFEKEVKK